MDGSWVAVAILGRTRGNRGEITAIPLSSKLDRYEALREVYLLAPGSIEPERREVETTWFHDATLIFKFRGVDSISDAERLSGCEVRVPIAERTALDDGEYFEADLIGCRIIERATGEDMGAVTKLDEGGGKGILVTDGGLMIPFARAICVSIDTAAKRIEVELPEGLRDLNAT